MPDIPTPILVNVDNYVRAETSKHSEGMVARAGGLNQFAHGRRPTPLDQQRIVRMNRDTLYSSALVDISAGATVKLPEAGDRYLSVTVINEDNFTTEIFHGGGTFELTTDEHDTPFVALVARVLVDWTDPADLDLANRLQDELLIEAASSQPYIRPEYDPESLERTHRLLQQLGGDLTDAAGCNGRRDEVRETRHMLATAFGWGGLPEYEVVYVASTTSLPTVDQHLTVSNVPVNGFWSISIYNAEGYFETNQFDSYSLNSVTAEPNQDGSVTLSFGTRPNGRTNFLYVMDGWSYNVRLYQPRDEAIRGDWKFPVPEVTSLAV